MQRFRQYLALRKQKIADAWSIAEMKSFVKDFIRLLISFKMLFIITAFGIYHYYDSLSKDEEVARMFREKYEMELVVLSVLNYNGLYVDNDLYTCRMENTKFKKDDFKWK